MADLAAINKDFKTVPLALDRPRAEAVLGAAAADHPAVPLVEGVVAPTLDRIGAGWDDGEVALSDIHMASRLREEVVERLLRETGWVSLPGHLNGVEMARWSPGRAEEKVKEAIAKADRGGGFPLGDHHGEIPWQVPETVPEMVLEAIGEAARRRGRYPLDWIGDDP